MKTLQHRWLGLPPAVRLTAAYVLVLMTICLLFSIVLYYLASAHLAGGLQQQYRRLQGEQLFDSSFIEEELALEKRRLVGQLVYFNFMILILGTVASFWLARRTLRPIELALESQSRFAADASHELRTPLAAMQTEIEVGLRNKRLSQPEAVRLLESNLEEVIKLKGLSDALLRLARQGGFEHQPVDLKQVAAGAAARLTALADQKSIKIKNRAKKTIVSGDQDSLTDLMAILLDNAIKYSPEGSAVELVSGFTPRHGWLTVRDQGQGIEQPHLPRIFDRFYRADTSRTGSGGYGLGLSIAKKIADLHGGSIVAESTRGKGSRFTLRLPRRPS